VIAFAENRDAALARATCALRSFPVLGIRTNIPFMLRLLEHPDVRRGAVHTGFIADHYGELTTAAPPPPEAAAAAALAQQRASTAGSAADRAAGDPWTSLRRWGR